MEKAVDLLSRQTVGGEGGVAMKTCMAYIKNALEKPEEEKFRSINLDNKAFKSRVANCLGGVALLRSCGFDRDEAAGRLFMSMEASDDRDRRTLPPPLTLKTTSKKGSCFAMINNSMNKNC
ncbi:unnamed protein product [Discosporangium mesarthrocarpum]